MSDTEDTNQKEANMPPPPVAISNKVDSKIPTTISNKRPAISFPLFKTPLKPIVPNGTSDKAAEAARAALLAELATMDPTKRLNKPISSSVRKPVRVAQGQNIPPNPQSATKKRDLPLSSTFKFDPKCVTGIPWIKPKKPTVPDPFKFASDQLKEKRKLGSTAAPKK